MADAGDRPDSHQLGLLSPAELREAARLIHEQAELAGVRCSEVTQDGVELRAERWVGEGDTGDAASPCCFSLYPLSCPQGLRTRRGWGLQQLQTRSLPTRRPPLATRPEALALG